MDIAAAVIDGVRGFIAPPPLSPLFLPGGQMEGWNEDLVEITLCILLLSILDVLIVRPFIAPKARYFALHAVANTISVAASWPDVRRGFTRGADAFNGPSHTMWANSAVAAIHIYHCIAFPLRAEDIFHHAVFVIVLSGLAIPYKQTGGIANNFGCFFLSGIPGGMDYVMLVLVAHGKMKKMTEKIWNARINVWLRGPGTTVYLILGWQAYVYDTFGAFHVLLLVLIVALHFINGQYYARQAVESYTSWAIREAEGRQVGSPTSPASPGGAHM